MAEPWWLADKIPGRFQTVDQAVKASIQMRKALRGETSTRWAGWMSGSAGLSKPQGGITSCLMEGGNRCPVIIEAEAVGAGQNRTLLVTARGQVFWWWAMPCVVGKGVGDVDCCLKWFEQLTINPK